MTLNLDALVAHAGVARFALLGEATHGTHEFYALRAEITKRLVVEHGIRAIAVEADWPDAYRVNCFIRGKGDDPDPESALAAARAAASLDRPIGENGTPFGDLFAADEEPPGESLELSLRTQALRQALEELSETEREVLTLRYGIDGDQETTDADRDRSPTHSRPSGSAESRRTPSNGWRSDASSRRCARPCSEHDPGLTCQR